MELQFIGADLGRGYSKGYTVFKGKTKECIFQSTIGEGRDIEDYSVKKPMHLVINNEETFIGELAEKESFNPISNYSDDKTTETAKKLLYSLINELAESEFVSICLGVPHKAFNKEVLSKVCNEYAGKIVTVIDKIKKTTKKVCIVKIEIFREADAALIHVVNNHPNRANLQSMRNGLVTIGFRTSELAYFDKGMKYNDKLSKSIELGNRTVLDIVQKNLYSKGITKELNEIDNDEDYTNLKDIGYKTLIEKINQNIEMNWINYKEMNIWIAGGTSKKFKTIPDKFKIVKNDNPQLITAKGLYFIAEKRG